MLEALLVESLSSHDVAVRRPEAVYQAFIVGLLVRAGGAWEVRSNRESGFGRCDLMVLPRAAGGPGAVIELKVLDARRKETVEQALDAAMAQIDARRYRAELEARGAAPIHAYGAVFDGKRVWVRAG